MPQRARIHSESAKRARSFSVSGAVLRSLRAGWGWTQAQAAARAGISERLLRKAESGGPIESHSIAKFAQLYSRPASPLSPQDLLAAPEASSQAADIDALVRRWYDEIWNKANLGVIDELAAPNGTLHAQGEELTIAAVRERFALMQAAFADFEFVVDQIAVQGELAVARWHVNLTHVGSWLGEPPSGKRFAIHGSSWIRVAGGRLQEGWDYWDQQQIIAAIGS